MRRALVLSVVAALAGCGDGEGAPVPAPAPTLPAKLARLYDYDRSAPLAFQEAGVREQDGAEVRDVSYAGPRGRVSAYLIKPPGDGPFPAVLFMHGAPGGRVTFFGEAVELAQRGVLSLLPDAPFARPPHPPPLAFTDADREQFVQTVVELRRGVDVLVARDDVDASRLGYVGFSWGGFLGAPLAAVERRVGSFALVSGGPHIGRRAAEIGATEGHGDLAAYEASMAVLDAVDYLPHATPNALFLQFGNEDEEPSPAEQRELAASASDPKDVRYYDAGHDLTAEARGEREDWLAARFGLDD
jgi:dienelactone hydrolase